MKKANRSLKNKKTRSSLRVEALEQRQLLAAITGSGTEVLHNVVHPNGNVYDQVLMTGSSVTVGADAGQVTRVSFLDLQGDIVQAEFSGAGTLTVSLDSFGAAAEAAKYAQPGVLYVSGVASFTIQGSDATTNFGVFSVGSTTAHNGAANPIFDGGLTGGNNTADIARLAIVANPSNTNGSTFGGIRAGNAIFSAASGTVGIAAANVQVQDVVTIGDIAATGSATPTLIFGASSQFSSVTVAGGDLVNTSAINNTGSYKFNVNLAAGQTSGGADLPAATNYAGLTFTGPVPATVAAYLPQTYTLTSGIDSFTGGAANDKFIGNNDTGGALTLTALDSINGGAGSDTLSVSLTVATNVNVASLTVANIENAVISSLTSTVTATTTGWTGLTSLTTSSVGGGVIVASSGTAVTATDTISGATLSIDGGSSINATVTGQTAGGDIAIGATTAPTGAVTVTMANTFTNAADVDLTTGAVITGGTSISFTQTTNAASATKGVTNYTLTQSDVTVTGTSATTAVTVNQAAAVGFVAGTASTGKVGIANGDVAITDVNYGSTSTADKIGTVTLGSFGAASISSSALATLNVSGTGTSLTTNVNEASGVAKATTLTVNASGVTVTGATTIDSDVTTLNISSGSGTNTLAAVSVGGATAVNISGDKNLVLASLALGTNPVITSTSTAGVTITGALATNVKYTGGAGADSIQVATSHAKAIALGAGDDTLTYNGATASGGSVAAGDGSDTIIMTVAQAAAASLDATFNGTYTGFEVLRLSDGVAGTVTLAGINGVSNVRLHGGASAVTVDGLASGGTVTLALGLAGGTINVTNAAFNAADSLNIALANNGVTYGTLTASNVETLNISSSSGASTTSGVNTLPLGTMTGTTTIAVTGSNGLTLTNPGTSVTTFDASAIAADNSNDTAALMRVTYGSAYTGASTTSISGGAGNDILSGNIKKDSLSGNAGADWLYGDNAGTKRVETFTVTGTVEANDVVTSTIFGVASSYTVLVTDILATIGTGLAAAITANTNLTGLVSASNAGAVVTVSYLVDGNTTGVGSVTDANILDLAVGVVQSVVGTVGTAGLDTISGGTGGDIIVGGGAVDSLTGGAGDDTFFFLKAQSTLASLTTISDYARVTGDTDKIVIGDVATAQGTVTTVQDLSVYASLGAAVDAAALANTAANGASVFIWGGDTYMHVETTGANTTYTAGDFVVKLTGTPLAAATTTTGKGFDF